MAEPASTRAGGRPAPGTAEEAAERDARLDERYGRRSTSPRRRRAAVAAVAVAAAAGVAWVAWASTGLREPVTHQVIGFSAPTDTAVDLAFQVTKDPGSTARCDVRALAEDYTTVGWLTVDIGPAEGDVVRREVEIRTQQRAVSAEIMGCDLLEA